MQIDFAKPVKWTVDAESEGERIDRYIARQSSQLSRKLIHDYVIRGAIRINKHTVADPSENIRKGDQIVFDPGVNADVILGPPWKKDFKIRVVYMDEHFIVVEKQSGLLSIPNHYKSQDNVVYYLRNYLQKKQRGKMPLVFYVHRLDKDTSGLMIFARHKEAQKKLKDKIATREIKRKYLGIVLGNMKKNAGQLVDFIAQSDNKNDYRQQISDEDTGKKAITHFRVRKRIGGFTLIEFSLETGRTHQIRLQMANRGLPLMGDQKYIAPKKKNLFDSSRLALHAFQLTIPHPYNNKILKFEAPLPKALTEFVKRHT